jgi:hypothetical protein
MLPGGWNKKLHSSSEKCGSTMHENDCFNLKQAN